MSRTAELIERARAATSLSDFGDDSFREGLEILVASIDAQARLTEIGQTMIDAQLVGLMSSRLQVEHWYALHPEIDEQEIVAPLIGLGLPRTGSSALGCMLAEDPAVRSLRTWEHLQPYPPPEAATQHEDPRIALAQQGMERRDVMFPRLRQMVPSTATSPSECQAFMAYDFKSQLFEAMVQVPDYSEWLHHRADLVPTYRYVKRVLKMLQWHCPPTNWRLKNPSHSIFIDALDKVFPDARFVMTHRDVARVIPSVADLYLEMTSAFSDQVDKHRLGELTAGFCELGQRRMIAFRDAGNDHRFFDVYFEPFQKDPYPTLARLYEFLGEEFTPETRARMEAWRRDTPRDKYGGHGYDPADFGLDVAALRERFRFYSERFGVADGGSGVA